MRTYLLVGPDGVVRRGPEPGTLGGHRRSRIYGRLDCAGALRWIERGHYVAHRVFFADEASAVAAGYRPCAGCLPERYRAWKAGAPSVRIVPRAPFDGRAVLDFLAARAVPGLERVQGQTLHRGSVSLRFDAAAVTVTAPSSDLHGAVQAARRVVDADADPAAIQRVLGEDAVLGPLLAVRPGLRSPGAFDAYEVGVRAIVGQAISVAAARTVLRRLAEAGLFPGRERLAEARPELLPMPALRASALIEHARGRPLGEIRGVGPWTLAYVAMRTGDPDVLLDGDLIVRRSLERLGGPGDAKAVARRGEGWSPFRSYATHHLWAAYAARA